MHAPDPRIPLSAKMRPSGRPVIGLALGSGAARGWAHVGVLRALDELGIEIDVYAGCSVGAIVACARLLGIYDKVLDWAKDIKPLSAMSNFGVGFSQGGLINPDKAFDHFIEDDRDIEDLPKPFAAVATDLATGREVWLARGSALKACRASAAIPILIESACYKVGDVEHWLVDGAATNPVPVNVCRAMGADYVIAVDLNAVTLALTRFNRPTTRAVVPVEVPPSSDLGPLLGPVQDFINRTGREMGQKMAIARARAHAKPQMFETVMATIDIVQAQLAVARAHTDLADVRLTPDLSCASAAAFDEWERFEEIGYEATMHAKERIKALVRHPAADDVLREDETP
jgi:NTE family protein